MRLQLWILGVTVATLLGSVGESRAEVLLSDSFNRTAGLVALQADGGLSDWGMNDNAVAGGTIVQTYEVSPTDAVNMAQQTVDGVGLLRFGKAEIEYDFAAVTAPRLVLEATITTPETADNNNWISFNFGIDDADTIGNDNLVTTFAGTDLSLLFRENGNGLVAEGGFAKRVAFDAPYDASSPTGGKTYDLRVELTNPAATPSTPFTASVFIDGVQVDLPGPGLSYLGEWDDEGTNYITFAANNAGMGSIDNLVISAVPEPASVFSAALAAVTLVGATRAGWIRQKR